MAVFAPPSLILKPTKPNSSPKNIHGLMRHSRLVTINRRHSTYESAESAKPAQSALCATKMREAF